MSPLPTLNGRTASAFSREEKWKHITCSSGPSPKTTIRCQRQAGGQKQTMVLQLLDEYVILWIHYQDGPGTGSHDAIMYIYFKKRRDIWMTDLTSTARQVGLLTDTDERYLCAKNSFKCFLVDLFLTQPENLLLLELIDEIENPLGRNTHRN